MLNALTNVRFWEQTGHLTNRCLLSSIYEYTALNAAVIPPEHRCTQPSNSLDKVSL